MSLEGDAAVADCSCLENPNTFEVVNRGGNVLFGGTSIFPELPEVGDSLEGDQGKMYLVRHKEWKRGLRCLAHSHLNVWHVIIHVVRDRR
jgi:hypothetical protein